MKTKQEYLLELPFDLIIDFSKGTGLIRDHLCFTKKDFIHRLLSSLTISECKFIYESYYGEKNAHEIIDWYLNINPKGEQISKDFVEYLRQSGNELGCVYYEFPIIKTRVDILRLTNNFLAYEVKSKRDKLDRLKYQIPALQQVFDFVYLIIPADIKNKEITSDLVRRNVGLITYSLKNNEISFEVMEEPESNHNYNPQLQLNLLRIEELKSICIKELKIERIDKVRKNIVKAILEHLHEKEINDLFKAKIRNRTAFSQKSLFSPEDTVNSFIMP